MSRSGYSDDGSEWQLICWRGQVASSIRGRRGQAFLRELIEALDAMSNKRLIAHELSKDGEVCALGSIGEKRGVNLETLDPYDYDALSNVFNVAHQLIQEIEWVNDEWYHATPEIRWQKVHSWAQENLKGES